MSRGESAEKAHSPRLSAVLFDLDDTLLDHRGAARDALRIWSSECGLTDSLDVLEARWKHLEATHYRRYQSGVLTKEQQRRARVREFLAPRQFNDRQADDEFAGYWAAYAEAWRPFPDAVPALRHALAMGLAIGILTNGEAEDQKRKVAITGLGELGIPVFASSELPAAKPDARAFVAACAALEASPEECLMVGDSIENDIEGAFGAEMPAVLLDRYGQHSIAEVRRIASLRELRYDGSDF